MNADILEEEQNFPYEGISLEEARIFRYLMSNVKPLRNGTIIRMYLTRLNEYSVNANGLVYELDSETNKELNKSFDSEINVYDDEINICSEITREYKPGYKQRDLYSIDRFIMEKDNIKVISRTEKQEESVTEIPYYIEEKARMR